MAESVQILDGVAGMGTTIRGDLTKIYAAQSNTDVNEGKGEWYDKTYHATYNAAVMAARNIGPMNYVGKVAERLALKLGSDKGYILMPECTVVLSENAEDEAALRDEALSKLTDAERIALLGK